MYTNVKLSEKDKELLEVMKENYKCEINIKPNEGYYFLQGDSFEILSAVQFVLIKLLETGVKLSKRERNTLCDGLYILKHYIEDSGVK